MNDAGYIIIPRRIFDEPLLKDDAYFRAWLQIVSEAAWKSRRVMVTNGRTSEIVELERGQLSHSRSYMAKTWGWSEKRVRTFLKRLEKVGMIAIQAGRLQTVITICNYNSYQGCFDSEGRQTGPQTGWQRARKGPEEEEIKEEKNRNIARDAKNPKGWPEEGFVRWYALYPRKKDRGAAEKAFTKARARGLIGFDELLAATSRFVEWTNDQEPQFIKYPATWLNADSYLNEPDKPKCAASDATIAEPSLGPQSFNDEDWKDRLRNNWEKGEWSNRWGPAPGEPGCLVPAALIVKPINNGPTQCQRTAPPVGAKNDLDIPDFLRRSPPGLE